VAVPILPKQDRLCQRQINTGLKSPPFGAQPAGPLGRITGARQIPRLCLPLSKSASRLVEDDPKDVEFTLTALEEYNLANEVVVTRDGEEALDYLYRRGPSLRERMIIQPSCSWI
jgi:hypothetical protein